MRDTSVWPDGVCPHGDPRPHRCALCRAEHRKRDRAAKRRARFMNLPDAGRAAAGDREDDDGS